MPGREPAHDEQLPLFPPADGGPLEPPPPTRHPWASLLRRVFAADMARCPKCDGRMRMLDVVTDPDDIARVGRGRGGETTLAEGWRDRGNGSVGHARLRARLNARRSVAPLR